MPGKTRDFRFQKLVNIVHKKASVELQGQLTRGQLVVDRRDWHAARARTPCNVNIVQALDMQLYKKMLLDAFGHPDIEF
ncbi:hypothetical protein FJT64_005755 [Amphibalanus amphitrite]|uniref:Uncharacterized protein n=1 Tax=Amphibalanus amphitrite TaxID=1232801 RepID=A0A6A4VZ01_AMPAM|nr:hypothetical protein FJT64_005755 [Amphibalanus amphitrite]